MTVLENLRRFVLVIGNARSGSTLLGAALDGHPQAAIANESTSSKSFWRDLSGEQIVADVLANSADNAAMGRPSAGYSYQVGPSPAGKSTLLIAGDKVWNPATLMLHGQHDLLPSLESRLGVPLAVIHAVRNPHDVIATMHMRTGAPVADRIRWYFMHCDAVAAIRDRLPTDRFLNCHHEHLVANPAAEMDRLCRFLQLPVDADHLAAVKSRLFANPRLTRNSLAWRDTDRATIQRRMTDFDFLRGYALADDPRPPSVHDNPTCSALQASNAPRNP